MKKKTLAGDILSSLSRYFAILVAVVILVILLSGIRIVESGEVALVFRFGKLVGNTAEEQIHEPGLLFAFPYIIDEVVTVPTGKVMKLEVNTHYTSGSMTNYTHNGYVISGDANIVLLSASVQYVITDPVQYTLNTKNETDIIRACVANSMIDIAASMSADELLTTGKSTLAESILASSAKLLAEAKTGITINTVELTNIGMPAEIKDSYDAVNAAKVNATTLMEDAEKYRNTVIPAAEASAASLISDANAKKAEAVASAQSTLSEFRGVLEEYEQRGEEVKIRVYNEKMSTILSKIGRIRVVSNGETKIVIPEGSN